MARETLPTFFGKMTDRNTRFSQESPEEIIRDLKALGYPIEEIRRRVGNHNPTPRIAPGSAQHIASMRPEERARYEREVLGKNGDANFHPAMEVPDSAGNHQDFVPPPEGLPKTRLAQRGFASRRYRYS